MSQKSSISLIFHLLLTVWMSLAVSISAQEQFHEKTIGVKRTPDSLIARVRKPRNAIERSDTISPPPNFLFMRNAPLSNTEVKMQDSLVLECEAGGSPPPTVHWLKDGLKLRQDDYLLTNVLPDVEASPHGFSSTKSRLFIDCVSIKDEGQYTCVADTPYQRVKASTNVFLTGKLSDALNPSCLPQKKSFAHHGQPARIYMWTFNLLQTIGEEAVLFCRATGTPTPSTVWRNGDGEVIQSDDKFHILDNGDLLIRRTSWSDMGEYRCEAKNMFGQDNIGTFLYPMAPENK